LTRHRQLVSIVRAIKPEGATSDAQRGVCRQY
jgi:hypothetical protein